MDDKILKNILAACSVVLLILIVATLIMSCVTTKYVPVQGSDSTRVEKITEYRDSIIYVQVPSESDKNVTLEDSSHVETSIAESIAKIREGRLIHSIKNKFKPLECKIKIPMTQLIFEQHINKPVIIEVDKELNWWQKLKLEAGGIAIGAVLLFIIVFLIKISRRFI